MLAKYVGWGGFVPYNVIVKIHCYHDKSGTVTVVYNDFYYTVNQKNIKLLNEGDNMQFPKVPFEATYINSSGKYKVGTKLTAIAKLNSGFRVRLLNEVEDEVHANSILPCISITKETLEKEIAERAEEIKELESKLAYLQQSGATEFDEEEYKIFSTLTIIQEPATTKVEKVKAIKKLLKLV